MKQGPDASNIKWNTGDVEIFENSFFEVQLTAMYKGKPVFAILEIYGYGTQWVKNPSEEFIVRYLEQNPKHSFCFKKVVSKYPHLQEIVFEYEMMN